MHFRMETVFKGQPATYFRQISGNILQLPCPPAALARDTVKVYIEHILGTVNMPKILYEI